MTCFRYLFTSSLFLIGQLSSFEMCAISCSLSLFSLLRSYNRWSTVWLSSGLWCCTVWSLGASDSYPWTCWWYVPSECWNPPTSGWNSIVGVAAHFWAGWCGNWILGVKRPECGADCPPLSSARLKMDWSHISAFLLCLHRHVIGQPLPLTHLPDWMESEPSTLQGKLFHILYMWRHLCLSMNYCCLWASWNQI
jgi:hypothetical protein